MGAGRIRALVVEPWRDPLAKDILNDLAVFQGAVGGYVEVISAERDVVLLVNEYGRLDGSLPNRPFNRKGWGLEMLFGTFLVVGKKGTEFVSLTPEQEEKYIRLFS